MPIDKPQSKLICSVQCPHCEGNLDIYKITKVLKPAEKAEKEEMYKAEKSTQVTLQ